MSADYPYTADGGRFWPAETPFLDPFVAIPAMAAVTTRLRFYTNVLKLGIREPLLVAKAVSSAAVLSNNRVGLGVGLSWIPEEFAWLGQQMSTRGARTSEAIEPVPIYVGGLSPAGLRRAARLGDGWISVVNSTEELASVIPQLHDLRREAGRDDRPFEIKAICSDVFEEQGFRRLHELGVTDAMVCPWYFYPGDPHDLDHQRSSLERFSAEVMSAFE